MGQPKRTVGSPKLNWGRGEVSYDTNKHVLTQRTRLAAHQPMCTRRINKSRMHPPPSRPVSEKE